jgi:hypothetical protein
MAANFGNGWLGDQPAQQWLDGEDRQFGATLFVIGAWRAVFCWRTDIVA